MKRLKDVKQCVVVVLMAVGCIATPLALPQQQTAAGNLDVVALLELYESGRFDDAIARVKAAGDRTARALRNQLRTAGSEWIDKARPDHERRLLVAASLALEIETLRVERGDWGSISSTPPAILNFGGLRERPIPLPPPLCQAVCMLDWARMLLIERGLVDAPVRAWFHSAIALAEGQRDWRYVYTLLGPDALAPARGLAHEAITAFPDDPWFQFDRALAMAARYNITRDGLPPGAVLVVHEAPRVESVTTIYQSANRTKARITFRTRGSETSTATLPASQPVGAVEELVRLSSDPVVGVDAQIRLGYLQWATGDSDRAQTTLTAAATAAKDADRRYLAHFLAGWTALRDGRDDVARQALAAALIARPDSQSATLALASLTLRHGEADLAHAQAEVSLARRPTDDDPWRLFLYGRFPDLPRLIAQLREEIRR